MNVLENTPDGVALATEGDLNAHDEHVGNGQRAGEVLLLYVRGGIARVIQVGNQVEVHLHTGTETDVEVRQAGRDFTADKKVMARHMGEAKNLLDEIRIPRIGSQEIHVHVIKDGTAHTKVRVQEEASHSRHDNLVGNRRLMRKGRCLQQNNLLFLTPIPPSLNQLPLSKVDQSEPKPHKSPCIIKNY